ncbi:MAG: DNA polymerase I [Anaerolineaceae bacterium]|nr:DNA polymerase I [Anaerolineaceae bacterium]
MPPTLYLIDGHALAYRSYFALSAAGGSRFQTKSGELTAGVYGFASILLRILEQDKPQYLAVAFDTGKTFRNEMFPDYKGTRAKMPDDLRPQIKRIREMIDHFNLPRLEAKGFEADDVLGTIAQQAVKQGFGVKIITGDRDLLQLASDRVTINLSGKRISEAKDYTPKDVIEYFGVRPDQVVDYKGLIGDSSDNIPGIAGVGPKTALTLFKDYETLEEMYAHLEELPPRIRKKMENQQEIAFLSRDLAQIKMDVPIRLELEDARTDKIDLKAVEKLFIELEFHTMTRKLLALGASLSIPTDQQQLSLFGEPVMHISQSAGFKPKVILVDDDNSLSKLEKALSQTDLISFDTETTSTDPIQADLVGISIATQPDEGYYIPIGHLTEDDQLPLEKVFASLHPFFTNPEIRLIGHNIKYDGLVLSMHGLTPASYSFDTMIAEWLTNPASRNLGLKSMSEIYLNINMTNIDELIGKGKKQITMAQVPIEKAAPYAVADAVIPLQLMPILEKKMDSLQATSLFNEMEMPLVQILAEMEKNGIALDKAYLDNMSIELNESLVIIQEKIFNAVGYIFNLNSTQQLSKALFESLKLNPPNRKKRTKAGHFSTSAAVLEQIRNQHPVIEWILDYRELSKLKSTYVDALPGQLNPLTQRIHTSFNQTGSVTGRLASSHPNLQNIPTRTEIGRRVRNAFVASPGKTLLAVDYSQIELRIVAHMSGDVGMIKAFQAGQDIHATTGAAIYSVPIEEVTKDQRRHAKAINFGLIYGMSAFGLSNTTGLTLAESEDFVKAYFMQFPEVKKYLDKLRKDAADIGYVETMLGRRRYFPNLTTERNMMVRQREEREAINAPIQGTAADIIKLAMIDLHKIFEEKLPEADMLLQIHDELIIECPLDKLAEYAGILQETMEKAFKLSVPLITDARSGPNWGELQPLVN